MLSGMFEVVVNLGVEQDGLGRNAAPVQTSASQFLFPFDQGYLEPILPGANRGGISARAAANDDHVVNCLCQS